MRQGSLNGESPVFTSALSWSRSCKRSCEQDLMYSRKQHLRPMRVSTALFMNAQRPRLTAVCDSPQLLFRSQLHHIFSKVWDTKISCFAEVGACGGLPQPRGLYKPSACLLRRGSTSPWGHVPTRAPQSPSIVLVGYPGRVFRALEKGERSRDE